MAQLPITAVSTMSFEIMLNIVQFFSATPDPSQHEWDLLRIHANDLHDFLHPQMQKSIGAWAILKVIMMAVYESSQSGTEVCLRCLVKRIFRVASLSTDIYCCAVALAHASDCPSRRGSLVFVPDLSGASDESQGGRVHRRRSAAAQKPYARPAARRGVPPRMEYDHILPPRIASRRSRRSSAREQADFEELTASFATYQPFDTPQAPGPDVEAITACLNTYSPFAAEHVPVPAPAPAAAAVQPAYTMKDLIEDFAGQRIPADEPVRGGDDVDLSAVIGKFARHTLNARPATRPRRAGYPY